MCGRGMETPQVLLRCRIQPLVSKFCMSTVSLPNVFVMQLGERSGRDRVHRISVLVTSQYARLSRDNDVLYLWESRILIPLVHYGYIGIKVSSVKDDRSCGQERLSKRRNNETDTQNALAR